MTASNTYGRGVWLPLTNKSGGGVIAGDVVVVDTTNNDAFTTTTAGAFTGGVGVAQGTIANNAVGLVAFSGYVSLVNVNASVTRGHFGTTYTVAKQATDFGAARGVGTFCQFLTGGTTPTAVVYPTDLLGSALTNPMSAVGDMIQGTTAGAPAALAAPLAGKVLTGAGVTTPLVYAYPPGYEFDYAETTSDQATGATTESGASAMVTGNAVTYDGSTKILIEYFCWSVTVSGTNTDLVLFDNGSSIGKIGRVYVTGNRHAVLLQRRLTPSAGSHTYSVRAMVGSGTSYLEAGAGGNGTTPPMFIRITKV